MDERAFLEFKLNKLKEEIKELEDNVAKIDWNRRSKHFLEFLKSLRRDIINEDETNLLSNSGLDADLSSKVSNFYVEKLSRNLRVNLGEIYVYDCQLQGATLHVRFNLKFVETVQGFGNECGCLSEVNAEISMIKGDPEQLSEWIECRVEREDVPGIVNGIVEFSNLARMRRSILQSLYKKGVSEKLGSCSIQVQGIEKEGVQVTAIGSDGTIIFTILWKISFCPATHSMMPIFDVEFNPQGFNAETIGILESLKKPYINESFLSEKWEALQEALIAYSE